ncbi:MAG: TPR repeat-containing protein YrrB [Deltaproteobacteria bacterium ADurb.BinA179]|jgi:Flp pilus assembly protein TadD|nr:tetratricopeptide repeat protein [Deltaproteobacteria bacterium]OPZ25855.1 MAG: TPR repeat-containing protein YrrB [Deltaproteobacteria bacterium ADurb.BinA179]HNV25996.1 tetratricopeptide repeat protein [Nitrospira sp.]HNZ34925.1 tetratricopeptide repeat protein [Syntrophales bacterium]HOH45118.1 tetratricopeptide repeat protein [Syntrophales bacterium]
MENKRLRQILGIGLLLGALTLILYWPVQHYGFVEFDDDVYVEKNPWVTRGITVESAAWAFRNLDVGFWHPLTWLSHLLDFEVYRYHAGGHHWTNVQIHLVSAILLFIVLSAMTGLPWASGLTAALFAVHPLHVESVTWISERKDVLSGFFWILTVGLYFIYVRKPTVARYLSVFAAFSLGMLSKPMLVTLPVVLLLLDAWPLQRLESPATCIDRLLAFKKDTQAVRVFRLIMEKMPFLTLSAASGVLAILAQESHGALASLEALPLELRLANAPVACIAYLWKMVRPIELAVFYPHPGMQPIWKVVGSFLILVGVTAWVIRQVRTAPHLAVGWFWYLISLLPVLGIIQVGSHSMADRYTYIPLIGIFIMIAWVLQDAAQRRRSLRPAIAAAGCVMVLGSMILASMQLTYWTDYRTLFEHANRVTERNHIACNNLGVVAHREDRIGDAVSYFKQAVEFKPDYRDAWLNLGRCHVALQQYSDAVACFRKAIEIDPVTLTNRFLLGFSLMHTGAMDESARELQQVVERQSDNDEARFYLGMARLSQGRKGDAEEQFKEVLRINPNHAAAHNNIGLLLLADGRSDGAIAHFKRAVELAPGNVTMEDNLRKSLLTKEKERPPCEP